MSSALFGSTARSSSKNLVEFKAGKMYMKGKMVHPDKRKGLAYVYQSDDTLMHFCWKDRTSGTIEEDLIIFPDDCEYKKVPQCTTGRVYVLRFKSNNRRIFFWMQEPKTDKDDEFSRKVNEYLNNPPAPGSQRSTSSTPNPVLGGSDLSNLQNSDIHNFIGNISQQQLVQILGGGVPSLASLLSPNASNRITSGGSSGSSGSSSASTAATTTASTATTSSTTTNSSSTNTNTTTSSSTSGTSTKTATSNSTSVQLVDLQSILSGISVPQGPERVPVDLGSVITAEALQPILTNSEFVEQLRPYLPSTSDKLPPVEELKGTVSSPQFQQAVNLFTSALQSGQLGPLINQFGLGEEAVLAATASDMEGFIKALGKKKDEEVSKKEETKKKGKDEDKD
ncbi:Proteasomal ubiquitin receptor ADRM1 [Armadillidium vulgare]|nr:Proteasomal ubiquitin receptor ADRM1 [Armadillidium vulgare]